MSSEVTSASFEVFNFCPEIMKALEISGYVTPTPIQEQSIPVILEGRDLIGQAKTGTGKTAAFALPLLERIDTSRKVPQVLVLTPTRELAIQVSEAFRTYSSRIEGFKVLPVYGGQQMAQQIRSLKSGVQVVVGTPGRLMDHLRRKTLKLNALQTVVLDEADEMLKMGFIEDIEWILEHTPKDKQVALFSATMPGPIRRVAKKYLKNEEEVKVQSKTTTVDSISQRYWLVRGASKLEALERVLETEDVDATIVFARTKNATIEIAEKLEAKGFRCAAMNGDLTQALRERTIKRLKDGHLDIVVATDVAARGLDVERISHVVNYDVPFDTESYVHRIGRTGRAGRQGNAILFVTPRERKLLKSIERATRQPLCEFELPDRSEITKKRVERFKSKITAGLAIKDLEFYAQVVDQMVSENRISLRDIAASLCMEAQKSSPLIVKEERETRSHEKGRGRERDRTFRRGSGDRRRESQGRRTTEAGMVSYRIEVGRQHGVRPSGIVAAIAEASGLEGKVIGKIRLHQKHSVVDLPEGMPKSIFKTLKRAHVVNRPMRMSELR